MSSPFQLRAHGRSGHASMPAIADNALVKAARLIDRLAAFRPQPSLGPETEAFLAGRYSTDFLAEHEGLLVSLGRP